MDISTGGPNGLEVKINYVGLTAVLVALVFRNISSFSAIMQLDGTSFGDGVVMVG